MNCFRFALPVRGFAMIALDLDLVENRPVVLRNTGRLKIPEQPSNRPATVAVSEELNRNPIKSMLKCVAGRPRSVAGLTAAFAMRYAKNK
jgi:hypothetical protein